MNIFPSTPKIRMNSLFFHVWIPVLASLLLTAAPPASAQRINLNFTSGADYSDSAETSPATPGGPAGSWNNISLTAANTDVAVVYSDGSAGPVLAMDIGRDGDWSSTSLLTTTANYTGSGSVYDVANLYESGFINAGNFTTGYRLKGLTPGTYAVHLIPMFRGYDAAGSTYQAGIHLTIGTGNTTDARDSGTFTLITTDADPEQNIDSSLTSWIAATDGSTPYNVVTATVEIDSTDRWLTFLLEDASSSPDRPGPAMIQIEPTSIPPETVPLITEIFLDGQDVILRGTNGPANSAYQVLATTNLDLPMYGWTGVATNQFDSSGGFDSTNAVTPGLTRQYFRLLLGTAPPPGPVAPTITTQPDNQEVSEGEDALFNVVAAGTPPLSYQWYYNTNSPLPDATNDTLSVTNAKIADAGTYSVVVSNGAGAVTSLYATLTVIPPAPPSITDEPDSQTVHVGQTATFTVTATGAQPLFYQWYYNTNTALAGDTNTVLMIGDVQTNDAGGYSVVVSNFVGVATSVVAALTVDTNTFVEPDFSMIGYATENGGTTGGAGGPTVTVTNFTDLEFYVDNDSGPFIIQVQGTINIGNNLRVRDDKTIVGLGTDATLVGNLKVFRNNNIIIRNLTMTNPGGEGDGDGLTLNETEHVWVDHCTFYDGDDGNLDITHGSDWITVSWCRFYYTSNVSDHRFSNLIGHSDSSTAEAEDTGKLHVTYHHCWWGDYVHERMPRIRFGRVHSFNNYFNAPGNNYCVRAARDCEVRIENNYFLDVHNPWEVYITVGATGLVHAADNILAGSTSFSVGGDSSSLIVPGTDTVFTPPYSYTLDAAADVPNRVTIYAGAGKGPFEP